MYYYIVHDSSAPYKEFLPDLLTRGLIKGLSPNQAIFSTFSVEMHNYMVLSDSKAREEYFKSMF